MMLNTKINLLNHSLILFLCFLSVIGSKVSTEPQPSSSNDRLPFITFRDKQNGRILAMKLEQEDDSGALADSAMDTVPWDDSALEGDIDLSGRPLEAIVDTIDNKPVRVSLGDVVGSDDAVADKLRLWPMGIIPYTLSTEFDENQRAVIALAMEEIQLLTCVRWLARRRSESDYVTITLGPDSKTRCRSYIGRLDGNQQIILSPDCLRKGIVMHEMMHTMGFLHEQSRSDRNQYVAIQWENLPGQRENKNFLTYGVDKIDNLGTNYDYSSLMHYPRTIDGIVVIHPFINVNIGQRKMLSQTDVFKINKLYKCRPDEDLKPVCDLSIECVRRAQDGQCQSNPAILADCMQYCQLCHKGGRVVSESTTPVPLHTSSSAAFTGPSETNSGSLGSQLESVGSGVVLRGVGTDYIACNFTELPSAQAYRFFAAINDQQYKSGQACGSCVQLTNGIGESIIVYIIDHCPSCEPNTYVVSNSAFTRLDFTDGQIGGVLDRIKSTPITCPGDYVETNIQIYTKPGSNIWWAAFQPRNMKNPITGISLMRPYDLGDNDWKELSRCCGGGYLLYTDAPPIAGSFKLKLEFVDLGNIEAGTQAIVVDIFKLVAGSVVHTGLQN